MPPPGPPKRPSSNGQPPPRRSTTTGQRAAVPRRSTASVPARAPAREEEPAPESNDTVMGIGDDVAESTAPGSEQGSIEDAGTEPPAEPNATVVFDTRTMSRKNSSAGIAAQPQGKLVVLKGPKAGAEFTLGPGETSIGRNADNTIVIPDISVSRRHVVLVKDATGWTLLDQGSGNGTLMNGAKVDNHLLQDGDTFSIGDTELQFKSVGGAPKRASSAAAVPSRRPSSVGRAPSRVSPGKPLPTGDKTGQVALPGDAVLDPAAAKRKKIMVAAGAVVVLLVGGGVMLKRQADTARAQAEAAAAQAQAQAQREAADAAFVEGKGLVGQGKFAEALPKFNEAKEKGSDDPEVEDYIARCTREVGSEKELADARDSLTKGQLAVAMELAGKVPADSLLSDAATQLKAQIKAAVPGRITEAKGKAAQKDFSAATAILEDALKVAPGDKSVEDAQDDIAKLQNQPPPVHTTRAAPKAVDHSQEVVQAFKDGDLKRAKDLAAQYGESDENVRRLGREISDFEAAWAKMDDDQSAFRTARDIDQRISKGHSFFSQKLNGHALSVFLKQCVTAKTAGKLGEAYKSCKAAHDADPSNAEANGVLAELQSKAKELWIQGYQEVGSDNDAARRDLQAVINMTPPDDETHGKAVRKLKEMDAQ